MKRVRAAGENHPAVITSLECWRTMKHDEPQTPGAYESSAGTT